MGHRSVSCCFSLFLALPDIKQMKNYNLLEYKFPLDYGEKHIGTMLYFQDVSSNREDKAIEFEEDFLGIIVNLSAHPVRFQFGGIVEVFPRSSFNFFFFLKNRSTITVDKGMTSILFVKYSDQFFRQFEDDIPLLPRFLESVRNRKPATLNPVHYPLTGQMLDDIKQAMSEASIYTVRDSHVRAKMTSVIACGIMSSNDQHLKRLNDPLVREMQEVYQYMIENLRTIHHPSTLVGRTKMTEKRFRKAFKMVHSRSVQDALKYERLKKSVQLLLNTQLSIQHISEEVGYAFSSSFVDAFKDQYGIYPREFRLQHDTD